MTTTESTVIHTNGSVSCPYHHPSLGFPLRTGNFTFKYVCPRCEPDDQVHIEQVAHVSDERLQTIYRYMKKRDETVGLAKPEQQVLSVAEYCIEKRGLEKPTTLISSTKSLTENEYHALQQYHSEVGALGIEKEGKYVVPLTMDEKEYLDGFN